MPKSNYDLPPELVGAYSAWKPISKGYRKSNQHTYLIDGNGKKRVISRAAFKERFETEVSDERVDSIISEQDSAEQFLAKIDNAAGEPSVPESVEGIAAEQPDHSDPIVDTGSISFGGDNWGNNDLDGNEDTESWLRRQRVDVSSLPDVFQIPLNGSSDGHSHGYSAVIAEYPNLGVALGDPEEREEVHYSISRPDPSDSVHERHMLYTPPDEERDAVPSRFSSARRLGAVAVGGWRAFKDSFSRHDRGDGATDTTTSAERKTKLRKRLAIGAAALAAVAIAVAVYRSDDDKPSGGRGPIGATSTPEVGTPAANIWEGDPYYEIVGTPVATPVATEEVAPELTAPPDSISELPAENAPETPTGTSYLDPEVSLPDNAGDYEAYVNDDIGEVENNAGGSGDTSLEIAEGTGDTIKESMDDNSVSREESVIGPSSDGTDIPTRNVGAGSLYQAETEQSVEQLGPELTIHRGDGFTHLLIQYRPELTPEQSYTLFQYLVEKFDGAENLFVDAEDEKVVKVYEMPNGDLGIKYIGTARFAPGVQEEVDNWRA